MTEGRARERLAAARVARLATVGEPPHVVPITFALLGAETIVSAIDHKPKRTNALRRLANIRTNPHAAVLADHYEDDWSMLWWVRADGLARVLEAGEEPLLRGSALGALASKYSQYEVRPPSGALIVIAVQRWSGWAAGRDV
jgi:PPOX class probable F420-dependent enzyme